MEIFVKVIREDLKTGEKKIAATAFLTFVALDENNRKLIVPRIIPETEEEETIRDRSGSGGHAETTAGREQEIR